MGFLPQNQSSFTTTEEVPDSLPWNHATQWTFLYSGLPSLCGFLPFISLWSPRELF